MNLVTDEKHGKIIDVGSFQHFMIMKEKNEKKLKCMLCFVNYPVIKKTFIITNITNNDLQQNENITTLYALDPEARTFCFHDGKYGHTITNGAVYNRCSDIDFDSYYNGNFTVGIEGSRVGTIIDLGSSEDLKEKYKYSETVGNGQGFASIHRKNNTIFILKGNAYNNTFQVMDESSTLFQENSTASSSVILGHLYLVRITDHSNAAFERIVKMLVIAYRPNELVTIRWELLI
ncbi:unnamed protein product [Adineta steineri]|uniref:Uncharacterized protein n=1 Tax=Adineta steineri TaxID=433720 RepID=A0A819D1K1_9BILA|nr:unnamed protein product [Adineta steineri]CAF3825768.1 unnamed protein product [Adineta steineri]